jgi:hypothetical protein
VIRLAEMTEKLKIFSSVIKCSGNSLNVRENNSSNIPVRCRMFVKNDSSIVLEGY